jgi:uncharacterized protein (DUF1015 family)
LAEILPFPGTRYNQEKVGDLSAVICPPYDVISPKEQKAYYERSPYNVIRLEHGLTLSKDTETENKHTRARIIFNKWLTDYILQADPVNSFYIHEHSFTYQNTRKKRLGLIACLRLEPWGNKIVFPHESTVPGIKSDRLQLMRACAANFSPLFGLYEDPGHRVTKLLDEKMERKPIIDITDTGDSHKLWMSNEPEFVQRVSHFIASKPVFIADGHHRYETALAYRDERRKSNPSAHSDEAFNFVMMMLVSFSDPGLVALPVHRLVQGISTRSMTALKKHLETFFEMEALPVGELEPPEVHGAVTTVLGLEPEKMCFLKPRNPTHLMEAMPKDHSDAYQRLDVSVVQHVIIEHLSLPEGRAKLAYTPDMEYARESVESGEFDLAFLLSPIPVKTIKIIAEADDRMPGKSTFFYPKVPTGLVINRLEGRL